MTDAELEELLNDFESDRAERTESTTKEFKAVAAKIADRAGIDAFSQPASLSTDSSSCHC